MEKFFINQKNNNSVIIGGVRVLAEFSSTQVTVGVTDARIIITGNKLKITRFDENEICVTGKVLNVETVHKGA